METTQAPPSQNESIVDELLRDFDLKEGARGIWNQHWEEVSQVVLPYYSTTFFSQGNTVPGVKRNQY